MANPDTPWGRAPHRLLNLREAWQVIWHATVAQAARLPPIGVEAVSLSDAAGRILAAPVVADEDYPSFDKSMMDGFAVRSTDCQSPEATLRILGLVPAGSTFSAPVSEGQCVQINTGAPVPSGADAVARVEDCTVTGDTVTLRHPVKPGQSIARRAGDRAKGDAILTPPLVIGPAQIAAAATAGAAELTVARRVGAAIVSTGDELVLPGVARREGQIYDSNSPMLAALLAQFGAMPHDLGFGRDTPESLEALLAEAMKQPVVVAVGGMSMGTLDLVPRVLESLGVQWRFHGVHMRPGKPVAYGLGPEGQHVFGLPGNPVSAFVCSWLFIRMVVRALSGFEATPPQRITVTLARDVPAHRDGRPAFVPARVWNDSDRGLLTEPCPWSGSGDPFGLAAADALLCLPEPDSPTKAGAMVEVIRLDMN